MDDKRVFEGFRKPEGNFFRLPNEWTDITSEIDNLPELKVIEYIARHTWGFQEYDSLKCITTDEFVYGRKRRDGSRMDKGTGLSATGVKEGIARAIKHGYVICEVDERDKARIKKSYGLKMRVLDSRDTATDSRTETIQERTATIGVSSDDHRSEKERKETNRMKEREKESMSIHSFAHSSSHASKPRKMGFIQKPVREVVQSLGGSDEKSHFERVHDLWLTCAIDDIKAFREEIYAAKTQATGKDMEYFYRCLERAVRGCETSLAASHFVAHLDYYPRE